MLPYRVQHSSRGYGEVVHVVETNLRLGLQQVTCALSPNHPDQSGAPPKSAERRSLSYGPLVMTRDSLQAKPLQKEDHNHERDQNLRNSSKWASHRINLAGNFHDGKRGPPVDYPAIQRLDQKRINNMAEARSHSPLSLAWRLDKLGITILPRIANRLAFWIVIACYFVFALVSQFAFHLVSFRDEDRTVFEGANLMISFMIVFYTGYCYNRFSEQYFLMTGAVRMIIVGSSTAKACFPRDSPELMRYWRLLNLMHVCCYCGMSSTYNSQNMRMAFCDEYGLLDRCGISRLAAARLLLSRSPAAAASPHRLAPLLYLIPAPTIPLLPSPATPSPYRMLPYPHRRAVTALILRAPCPQPPSGPTLAYSCPLSLVPPYHLEKQPPSPTLAGAASPLTDVSTALPDTAVSPARLPPSHLHLPSLSPPLTLTLTTPLPPSP